MRVRILCALAAVLAGAGSAWAQEAPPAWLTGHRGQPTPTQILDSPSDRKSSVAEENFQPSIAPPLAPDAAAMTESDYSGAGSCDSCGNGCCGDNGCCGSCCCNQRRGWLDNTQIWYGGEAYKSIGDSALANFNPVPFALGNNFGSVGGLNTAFGLGNSRIRAQLGGTLGLYDFSGRTVGNSRDIETQCFITAGFFKRSDICCGDRIAWGVVYDQFFAGNWGYAASPVTLGQFRGILGYALNECNEVGLWGTLYAMTDTASFGFPAGNNQLRIHATNQLNAFWRHNWELGASTMVYGGVADQGTSARFVTGLIGQMPLNDCWSAYGNFTYVSSQGPLGTVASSQEQWNVAFGLMYSFGGKARSWNVSGQQGIPLLPVANNGTFLITQQ